MVQHAFRSLTDPATVWRMRYQLAPTDPRFLDMTEEQILHDLVVLAFHDEEMRRSTDPTPPEADDPDALAKYEEHKQKVLDGDLTKRLALLLHGRPEPVKKLTINVRGWG